LPAATGLAVFKLTPQPVFGQVYETDIAALDKQRTDVSP
jgi:hypothetical protein